MYPIIKVTQPGRTQLYLTIIEPVDVGRECDGLLLADEKVSRQHLRLSPAGSDVLVTDLGSTNGSFLNQMRITGEAILQAGSSLTLGDTTIIIETPTPPAATGQTTRRDVGGTVVATLDQLHGTPPTGTGPGVVAAPEPAAAELGTTRMDEIVESFGGRISLPSGAADDTVTIMFSDIESSTELALRSGDHRWYEILSWHNQLIEQRVAAHGGFIVKNQGDGFMVTFNSARRAIICASEIQKALHQHAVSEPSNPIRVRIGLHTGEAIRQDSGDLFGRHVIIAARVGALANGAEILVSSIVREITSARGDLHFGDGTTVELKGVGDQVVYPVLWGAELPAE